VGHPCGIPITGNGQPTKLLRIHNVKQRVVSGDFTYSLAMVRQSPSPASYTEFYWPIGWSRRCRFFLGLTSPTTCYRVCGRRDHLKLPERLQSGLVSGLSRLLGSGGSSPD